VDAVKAIVQSILKSECELFLPTLTPDSIHTMHQAMPTSLTFHTTAMVGQLPYLSVELNNLVR
jgi:hypothetical protein